MNKNIVMLCLTAMILNGCGNFNLGYVKPQDGKNSQQQQIDTLACQNEAKLAASTAGMQISSFLLGMTLVGYPLVYVLDKSAQRDEFANCLHLRGYAVLPADTNPNTPPTGTNQIPNVSSTGTTAISPSSEAIKVASLSLPLGFNRNSPPVASGWQLYAVNNTLDIGMLAGSFKRNTISDVKALASSKKSMLESNIGEAQALDASEVLLVKVNEKDAFRFQYNTIDKAGLKRTYQVTFLEYNQEVLHTNVWTSASNFALQKNTIETIPASLLSQLTGDKQPQSAIPMATSPFSHEPINENKSLSLDGFKTQCQALGFKAGTTAFGNCVLELNEAK